MTPNEVKLLLRADTELERLLDALGQAHERMETAFYLLHPGDLTADERDGIALNLWFGMEEIDAAVALGDTE